MTDIDRMDTFFDPDTQYQLTDEDRTNGWAVEIKRDSIEYRLDRQRHNPSPDQPAHRQWWENGQIRREFYYQNGQLHNPSPGQPACRQWYDNGQLEAEWYYQVNQLHDPAPGVPAVQQWHSNGQLWCREHYQNRMRHSPSPKQPSFQCLDENGQLVTVLDHYHGVIVSADFWEWTIEDALLASNSEQRRVWFEENGGWEELEDRFILIDEQDDPGNLGHKLRLCSFPQDIDSYEGQANIIFCDNASLDLNGTRRRYALVVPFEWGANAVTVMARSFGLSREEYEQMSVAK